MNVKKVFEDPRVALIEEEIAYYSPFMPVDNGRETIEKMLDIGDFLLKKCEI